MNWLSKTTCQHFLVKVIWQFHCFFELEASPSTGVYATLSSWVFDLGSRLMTIHRARPRCGSSVSGWYALNMWWIYFTPR